MAEHWSSWKDAQAYPGVIHDLLVIDASSFINAYFEKIRLSPINSGATLFNAPNRGRDLFKTLDDFPFEERRHRGNDAVAELTIESKVEILRFVTRVDRI